MVVLMLESFPFNQSRINWFGSVWSAYARWGRANKIERVMLPILLILALIQSWSLLPHIFILMVLLEPVIRDREDEIDTKKVLESTVFFIAIMITSLYYVLIASLGGLGVSALVILWNLR